MSVRFWLKLLMYCIPCIWCLIAYQIIFTQHLRLIAPISAYRYTLTSRLRRQCYTLEAACVLFVSAWSKRNANWMADDLKAQYLVTAHQPRPQGFSLKKWEISYLTGCREFKRREESRRRVSTSREAKSKRTLKNPFASSLAEFDTTLKLLIY